MVFLLRKHDCVQAIGQSKDTYTHTQHNPIFVCVLRCKIAHKMWYLSQDISWRSLVLDCVVVRFSIVIITHNINSSYKQTIKSCVIFFHGARVSVICRCHCCFCCCYCSWCCWLWMFFSTAQEPLHCTQFMIFPIGSIQRMTWVTVTVLDLQWCVGLKLFVSCIYNTIFNTT